MKKVILKLNTTKKYCILYYKTGHFTVLLTSLKCVNEAHDSRSPHQVYKCRRGLLLLYFVPVIIAE